MAFVVKRGPGRYELRESRSTVAGPRSRTLATFATLTGDLVDQAIERAEAPLTRAAVIAAADRGGAPVERSAANAAAASLLGELTHARDPAPGLARVLIDALGPADPPTDSERAAAEWANATLEQRAQTIRELLLLGDLLPKRERAAVSAFPGFRSAA